MLNGYNGLIYVLIWLGIFAANPTRIATAKYPPLIYLRDMHPVTTGADMSTLDYAASHTVGLL